MNLPHGLRAFLAGVWAGIICSEDAPPWIQAAQRVIDVAVVSFLALQAAVFVACGRYTDAALSGGLWLLCTCAGAWGAWTRARLLQVIRELEKHNEEAAKLCSCGHLRHNVSPGHPEQKATYIFDPDEWRRERELRLRSLGFEDGAYWDTESLRRK